MFSLFENNQEFELLNKEAKLLVSQLLADLTAKKVKIPLDINFAFEKKTEDSLYLIQEGFVCYEYQEKPLFFYDSGDIIGWQDSYLAEVRIVPHGKIFIDEYSCSELYAHTKSKQELDITWRRLLSLYQNILVSMMSQTIDRDITIKPETRHYTKGSPIIIQGTTPTEVFTMVRGVANVFLNDVKVGEIKDGEMFGAMAAATKGDRSASVIAAESCLVLVVSKDNFLTLARTHPQTMLKLVEDMSRIIMNQNEKLRVIAH